jgi:integral membrane protein
MASNVSSRTVVPDRLQGVLGWYRIAAYITGVLLILLSVEIIAKYGFGAELEMGGSQGFMVFVPDGTVEAINLSSLTLIVHGWFYIVYLFTCFRLWSTLRWPFWRFLWLASGGLLPFLSFPIEHYATKTVRGVLAEIRGES